MQLGISTDSEAARALNFDQFSYMSV